MLIACSLIVGLIAFLLGVICGLVWGAEAHCPMSDPHCPTRRR